MKRTGFKILILAVAVAGAYTVGATTAFAFTCSQTGCNDYAEGFCSGFGGVGNGPHYDEESGECYGLCNEPSGDPHFFWEVCDDV